jgi:hypothetical protein
LQNIFGECGSLFQKRLPRIAGERTRALWIFVHFIITLPLSPGLPDGIFSNQKSQFWLILEGLAMEDVGIFYDHLVYFTAIWYIMWPFGIFYGYLEKKFPFWNVEPRRIWQPCLSHVGSPPPPTL